MLLVKSLKAGSILKQEGQGRGGQGQRKGGQGRAGGRGREGRQPLFFLSHNRQEFVLDSHALPEPTSPTGSHHASSHDLLVP